MRERCDLSNQYLTCGDIGRLMGFGRFPVIGCDSFETDSMVQIRLGQLRRPLTVDIKVDLFAFYCPYRYTYGDDWVEYIRDGGVETVTFPTLTGATQPWLGTNKTTIPKHIFADGVSIFNNYFKDPSEPDFSDAIVFPDGTNARVAGPLCYHLKTWGTAQSFLAEATSPEFDAPVVSGDVSIFDIQTAAMKARQKQYRDYFSSRYVEIMKGISGMDVSDYTDNRPEFLWRETQWCSGYDINGTSGAQFGQSTGKAVAEVRFRMPRRAFPEHGTLYFFALLRMPPVFDEMVHYLDNFNRPFEDVVPGSGELPPRELLFSDVFNDVSSNSMGFVPSYEWYRSHPSFVHPQFTKVDTGWQFLGKPGTPLQAIQCGNYGDMFATVQNRQFILNASHRITAYRPLPSGDASIMGVSQ